MRADQRAPNNRKVTGPQNQKLQQRNPSSVDGSKRQVKMLSRAARPAKMLNPAMSIVFLFIGASITLRAQSSPTCAVSLRASVQKAGIAVIVLTNIGEAEVTVTRTVPENDVHVVVRDPAGKVVEPKKEQDLPSWPPKARHGRLLRETLRPGGALTETVAIDHWLSQSKPGQYTLEFTRSASCLDRVVSASATVTANQ